MSCGMSVAFGRAYMSAPCPSGCRSLLDVCACPCIRSWFVVCLDLVRLSHAVWGLVALYASRVTVHELGAWVARLILSGLDVVAMFL